jgi:hypothetical protein
MENSRIENPNYLKKLEEYILKSKRRLHQRVRSVGLLYSLQ